MGARMGDRPNVFVGDRANMRRPAFLLWIPIVLLGCSAPAPKPETPEEAGPTPAPVAGADVGVEPDTETVILVHGLGRTRASMVLLGNRLEAAGFRVVNIGYPSTREPMERLVEVLREQLEECCTELDQLHFATHSMGGIVVRRYLAEYSPEHKGRVVMLSPPSQGSEVIDAFADSPLLQRLLGPSGSALGTDSMSIPNQMGPAQFELGIITGDRTLNPINSWLIPGPDDGKVAVERARVEGAAFLVVPAPHPFIMNREDVAAEVAYFLRHGRFLQEQLPDGGQVP